MANQQQAVVGYACEFIDVVPKELQTECSICLHVLRDPYMVDCCGYRFCKLCIERVLLDFKSCPLCNHRGPTTVADKQLSRTLREKTVRCTHKEDGCRWVGVLSALDQHLDTTTRVDGCLFKLIRCHYCDSMFRLNQIVDHESVCALKPLICEYCGVFQCLRRELPEHWDSCALYPIVCPKGCGAKITRIGLDKHFKHWCPLSVVDCEFAHAGCKVRMRRKCMKSHLDEAAKDHLHLMTKKFSEMKVAYEREQNDNKTLKLQLESVKEELEEEKFKQITYKDSEKDEENTVLKKLCALRQDCDDDDDDDDDGFCDARDQVLIHNLPGRTTEQMLKSLFGQNGPIHCVKLYSEQCIGVIEYKNNESIQRLFQRYNSTGIRLLKNQLKCIHLQY